jgi:aminoglycoside phosphotransferase (APT) family kinase protein
VSTGRMHADEVLTDASLVQRLLVGQFPHWSDLPIEPVASAGTDHALYRLGDDLMTRLPRIHWAVGQVEKELRWLPKLAPHLPLAIPEPLAMGEPAEGYPWRWGVYRWLPGQMATRERIADLAQAATDLAAFVVALQRCDTTDGPRPGMHASGRGVPLARRDTEVRGALARLHGEIDTDAATAAWEHALRAPAWDCPPVWLHGDLASGNLLVDDRGRLSAVIDFGCLVVGDPACELQVAWTLFAGESRALFRSLLKVDDATWARGRGWALSVALLALPYYLHTNPTIVAASRHAIAEVLADRADAD